jgi:hypothetical protein
MVPSRGTLVRSRCRKDQYLLPTYATAVAMIVSMVVEVQHGVAEVGDGQADDADDAELGELVDDLPEPYVQAAYHSHRAINSLSSSSRIPIMISARHDDI